jgi:hypothetical protein
VDSETPPPPRPARSVVRQDAGGDADDVDVEQPLDRTGDGTTTSPPVDFAPPPITASPSPAASKDPPVEKSLDRIGDDTATSLPVGSAPSLVTESPSPAASKDPPSAGDAAAQAATPTVNVALVAGTVAGVVALLAVVGVAALVVVRKRNAGAMRVTPATAPASHHRTVSTTPAAAPPLAVPIAHIATSPRAPTLAWPEEA